MTPAPGVDLWWLPLGAGGHFVRVNGRVYERLRAWSERRMPRALYHSALVVFVPEGRFVIENAWPIPDEAPLSRGVVVEGPVFGRALGRFRVFRYEVRCWRDGTIRDAPWGVHSPQRVSEDEATARRVLSLARDVPAYVWGRKPGHGEMWNSNSVIAWILASAGLDMDTIKPPPGGRAPGWETGVTVARVDHAAPIA